MNRLEILPEELQNKIYYEAHKQMMSEVFEDVKYLKSIMSDRGYIFEVLLKEFYKSDMSDQERLHYFTCLDCADGKLFEIRGENLINNRYRRLYLDYWEEEE
jgi:hypothetical protein